VLGQAVADTPGFAPAQELLADFHLAASRSADALVLADAAERAGRQATADYLRARTYVVQGKVEQAVKLLGRVIDADQDHVSARITLARALVAQGDTKGASQNLQVAARLTRDAEAIDLLIRLHLAQYRLQVRLNEVSEARSTLNEIRGTLEQLIRQEPTDGRALVLLGQFQRQRHQYDQAAETIETLMTLSPDNVLVRMLKVRVDVRSPAELAGPRRLAEAMADLDVAERASPSDAGVWALRAEVLEAAGRYDQAAEALRKALQLRAEEATYTMRLAGVLRKADRPGQAADALAALAETNTGARILYTISLVEADRAAEAVAVLRRRIDAGSADRLAPLLLAYATNAAGDTDEALAAADKALAAGGDDTAGRLIRGLKVGLLARAGRYDDMIAYATDWFTGRDASYWLGGDAGSRKASDLVAMVSAGSFTAAQRARWGVVAQAATPVHLAAGWLMIAGRDAEAVDFVLDRVAKLDADDATESKLASRMRSALLGQLVLGGRDDLARRIYPSLLAADEDNAELLALGGSVYSRPTRADRVQYENLLSRALQLSGDDAQLKNNLAYGWADRGVKLLEAQRLLNEAIEVDSRSHIRDSLAWVLYKKGEFRPALAMLTQAINSPNGDDPVLYDHAGDVYWRLGRRREAIAMWTEAADLAAARLAVWGGDVDADTRRVHRETPRKIRAAQDGQPPKAAPLGVGVRP